MAKFRKRPVVVEAVRWTGNNYRDVYWFANDVRAVQGQPGVLTITTPEGVMMASTGDWIIKGVKGEFYPCKPDIFAATYEPVDG